MNKESDGGEAMGNLFFTSDQHFGHARIIEHVKRPFKDVYEQTERLIENFNSKVKPGDHTWHLGDFLWQSLTLKEALDIAYRLNGTHSLVLGNHDKLVQVNPVVFGKYFKEICDLKVLDVGVSAKKEKKLILCHYGMRVWPHSQRGSWHLYGHSHGELPPAGFSFDVGVDSPETKFFPLELEEVRENMSRRTCNHILGKIWPNKEKTPDIYEKFSDRVG